MLYRKCYVKKYANNERSAHNYTKKVCFCVFICFIMCVMLESDIMSCAFVGLGLWYEKMSVL